MEFVIALIVLAAALAALAFPLYRAQQQPATMNVSTLDNLLAQRDNLYTTLRDLELDKQLGKIDDADYNALREKYMTQASTVLQQIDLVQGQGSAAESSAALETEIAALRRQPARKKSGGEGASSGGFCRNCGKGFDKGDKFCAKCGQALN